MATRRYKSFDNVTLVFIVIVFTADCPIRPEWIPITPHVCASLFISIFYYLIFFSSLIFQRQFDVHQFHELNHFPLITLSRLVWRLSTLFVPAAKFATDFSKKRAATFISSSSFSLVEEEEEWKPFVYLFPKAEKGKKKSNAGKISK